jgi:beta-mannosidase
MGWFKQSAQKEAYERFFFHELPELLAKEDPQHPYWPGSPTSNAPFNQPNSDQTGDAHLWEVFAEYRPPVSYRQQNPRFISEFGFQSLPGMETIQKFALDEPCKFDSPVMRCHQRAPGGNPRLTWYLTRRFRLPRSLAGLVYLSQVLQAEAIRTGVEHWRRSPERTSGILYWQLNDCWPVISWSSIDYYGKWKALHYAARRFYAPVLLSIEDKVEKGQRKMDVWVTNDHCAAWQGRVHWTLETLDGEVIEGGDQPVHCEPQSAGCLLKLDFAHQNGKVDWRRVIFTAELWQGSERQALQVATFTPELNMPFVDPGLHAEIHESGERLMIRVQAKRLARFVELSLAGTNAQFSDNFFDLPAGRMATIDCELPEGWALEQARAALQVHSLADSGPYDSPVASRWKGSLALLGSLLDLAWKGLVKPAFKKFS